MFYFILYIFYYIRYLYIRYYILIYIYFYYYYSYYYFFVIIIYIYVFHVCITQVFGTHPLQIHLHWSSWISLSTWGVATVVAPSVQNTVRKTRFQWTNQRKMHWQIHLTSQNIRNWMKNHEKMDEYVTVLPAKKRINWFLKWAAILQQAVEKSLLLVPSQS